MRRLSSFGRGAVGLGLAAAVGVGAIADAAADDVHGTRAGDKLVERDHVVSVEINRGHAKLVVRRTLHNGGDRHDQAELQISPPAGSAAIGLRTLGMLAGRPQWFAGDLMEAEAAAKKYRELTGIGGYYPKDPALLSWRQQGLFALQVFPVDPGGDKTIEYTLLMPTEYRGGRDHLKLAALGTEALRASATVRSASPNEAVFEGGRKIAASTRIKLDRDDGVDVSVTRSDARLLGGALAVIPIGRSRVLLGQRVDAAPRLGEVPRGARVVVAIDASRSLSPEQVAAEVAAARAYLSHFEDAEVEVILFERRTTATHGKFVPAKQAIADLERLTITRRNGSNVDLAMQRAATLFAAAPARAAKRLVILTDARTRRELTPERLRNLAGATSAIVHVGVVKSGAPALDRDDEHEWAKVARKTGGLVWSAAASADASEAAAMKTVYEEWARPRRIDRLRFTTAGDATEDIVFPERLDEGEGFADLRIVGKSIGWLKVAGELWSKPISTVLVPDPDEARRDAALVFGSEVLHSLTEPEMMVLAKMGNALSPVTSFLAVEPGVRPSTEGLWGDEIGDSFSIGSLGLSGIGEGGGGRAEWHDIAAFLRGALAGGWKACGGGSRKASVTLEMTPGEIVDVSDARVSGPDPAGLLSRCLEEAAWEIELSTAFVVPSNRLRIDL